MNAWLLDNFDGIDALRLGEIPDPTPAVGEVLLRVKLAALNPADYYLAQGQYPARPPLPHVLGRDGLGVVEAVGEGVTDIKVGDERLILRGATGVERFGTFAEKVVVAAGRLGAEAGRLERRAGGRGEPGVPDGVAGADAVWRGPSG